MVLTAVGFLAGLVALYYGAEALVGGSSSLALRFGIAPLVVGLTVVAFGTSAPELLVSLLAVFDGKDGISVGNIIGSNIANIALILGCASMVRPMSVNEEVVKREYPIMLGASIVLCVVAHDLLISRADGVLMLTLMVAFLGYSLWKGLRRSSGGKEAGEVGEASEASEIDELEDIDPSKSTVPKDIAKLVVGIVLLAGGAYLLVESAIVIAKALEIPDLVIGITMVAVGTSLPELATSVIAAYRGESDISVGNVIGSNVFNILLVLGVVAVIAPIAVGQIAVDVDLWVMLAISILIWPLMRSGYSINRLEGACLLVGYVAYTVYLFMR